MKHFKWFLNNHLVGNFSKIKFLLSSVKNIIKAFFKSISKCKWFKSNFNKNVINKNIIKNVSIKTLLYVFKGFLKLCQVSNHRKENTFKYREKLASLHA